MRLAKNGVQIGSIWYINIAKLILVQKLVQYILKKLTLVH